MDTASKNANEAPAAAANDNDAPLASLIKAGVVRTTPKRYTREELLKQGVDFNVDTVRDYAQIASDQVQGGERYTVRLWMNEGPDYYHFSFSEGRGSYFEKVAA